MGHVAVSRLAYAHPGGDLLFSNVLFRVSVGEHVGLGANGVGKSTLLGVLVGSLIPDQGDVSVGGIVGYMPQDVGVAGGSRTVRELLLALAPLSVRRAGERVLDFEARLAAGDDAAGIRLGTAIADWSALGGYELEGQWDAACRRIVGAAFGALADRRAVTLSGGEREPDVAPEIPRTPTALAPAPAGGSAPRQFARAPAHRQQASIAAPTSSAVHRDVNTGHDADLASEDGFTLPPKG